MKRDIPTYYDIKYASTSKIFEAEEIMGLRPDQILEGERAYRTIVEKLENGEPIDEGFLTGLLGAGAGALIGPTVGRAICTVLGIKEDGPLGKLLTSRVVTTAMGYALAK